LFYSAPASSGGRTLDIHLTYVSQNRKGPEHLLSKYISGQAHNVIARLTSDTDIPSNQKQWQTKFLPARSLSALGNVRDLDATLLTKFLPDLAPKLRSSFSSSFLLFLVLLILRYQCTRSSSPGGFGRDLRRNTDRPCKIPSRSAFARQDVWDRVGDC
jgi:hypothetical protein